MKEKEKILGRIADVIEYNYKIENNIPSNDGMQCAIDNVAQALIKLTETQYQMEFETEE